ERVALAQNMDLAGLGAVEREFALEAMISLGAVVVGLEIGRVPEAGANRHFEAHHVDLGARTIDPVRDESRLLIAPQKPRYVGRLDEGGPLIGDAARTLRLEFTRICHWRPIAKDAPRWRT